MKDTVKRDKDGWDVSIPQEERDESERRSKIIMKHGVFKMCLECMNNNHPKCDKVDCNCICGLKPQKSKFSHIDDDGRKLLCKCDSPAPASVIEGRYYCAKCGKGISANKIDKMKKEMKENS